MAIALTSSSALASSPASWHDIEVRESVFEENKVNAEMYWRTKIPMVNDASVWVEFDPGLGTTVERFAVDGVEVEYRAPRGDSMQAPPERVIAFELITELRKEHIFSVELFRQESERNRSVQAMLTTSVPVMRGAAPPQHIPVNLLAPDEAQQAEWVECELPNGTRALIMGGCSGGGFSDARVPEVGHIAMSRATGRMWPRQRNGSLAHPWHDVTEAFGHTEAFAYVIQDLVWLRPDTTILDDYAKYSEGPTHSALDICGDTVTYHPEVDSWTNSVAGAKNIRAIMWQFLDTSTDNHDSQYQDTVDVTLEDMMDAYVHWYDDAGTGNRKRDEYSDSVVAGTSCHHHDDCTSSPYAGLDLRWGERRWFSAHGRI